VIYYDGVCEIPTVVCYTLILVFEGLVHGEMKGLGLSTALTDDVAASGA